jgi:hypothetical protein
MEVQGLERAGRQPDARPLLERLAGQASRGGLGKLFSALAFSKLYRQQEARRTLDEWAEATRDPQLAAWGRAVFDGQRPELARSPSLEQRVISGLQGR